MNNSKVIQTTIIIIGALLFVPFLGYSHLFDWDEINFAESAREMLLTKDFLSVQINFEPFWEKPPLFIWMQALSMKIFGVNEFAARFPNAVCGIITLLVLFNIGKKHFSIKFGILWTAAYAGSILPHFYFKSGIIDPWFNLFIFLGIYFFFLYLDTENYKKRNIVFSAIFIGLGVLTKGPVAALVFLLTGFFFLIFNRLKMQIKFFDIIIYLLVFIIVGGFWFLLQIINGNTQTIVDFIIYQIRLFQTQDAGHGGFFGYHFVVLILGVFPASIFALKSFKKFDDDNLSQKNLKKWMSILFGVILILFSIVKTKIVHYSSLCYYPLTFFAAYAAHKIILNYTKWNKWINIALLSIVFVYTTALAVVQYFAMHTEKLINKGFIKDKFVLGILQANVQWSGYEFAVSAVLIIGICFSLIVFKTNYYKKIICVFVTTLLFTNLTILVFISKIEGYSQRAAIDFFKQKQREDCYVETLGFKSYAKLFYLKKTKPANKKSLQKDWLLNGKVDKNTYFVTKNIKANHFLKVYPQLKIVQEKNGFVFLQRKTNSKP